MFSKSGKSPVFATRLALCRLGCMVQKTIDKRGAKRASSKVAHWNSVEGKREAVEAELARLSALPQRSLYVQHRKRVCSRILRLLNQAGLCDGDELTRLLNSLQL